MPSYVGILRHLANTIEPSVRGGDAVLCQITLTTCYNLFIIAALSFLLLPCHLFEMVAKFLLPVFMIAEPTEELSV